MSGTPPADDRGSGWSRLIDTESLDKEMPIRRQTNEEMTKSLSSPITMPKTLVNSNSAPPATMPPDEADCEVDSAAEERLTSHFVHALCRLHEASRVVTATCNHFMSTWTGLSVTEVTIRAVLAASRLPDVPLYRPGHEYCKILKDMSVDVEFDAILMQALLRSEQAQMMITGATAGLALQCRNRLQAQNRAVLPLTALADDSNARTLAAFTRRITTMEGVSNIGSNAEYEYDAALRAAHIMEHNRLIPYLRETHRRLSESQARFTKFTTAVFTLEGNRHIRSARVSKCMKAAILEACMAAENLKLFTDMIFVIVICRKRFHRYVTTIGRALCGNSPDPTMMDVLNDARRACEQAISATQAVRATLIRPGMSSSLEES